MSFNDALELIMVLPGKMAKAMRVKFADIIKRHLAGDASLVAEIEANAASVDPVAQMARASLETEPTAEDRALPSRKTQLELEDMELGFRTKRAKVEALELANQTQSIANYKAVITGIAESRQELSMIKNDAFIKSHVRQAMEQTITRALVRDLQPLLAAPLPAPLPSEQESISICSVAKDMGYPRLDARASMAIGVSLARYYRERHAANPPTRVRLAYDGAVIPVNVYTERDRDLIERAIREHMEPPPQATAGPEPVGARP